MDAAAMHLRSLSLIWTIVGLGLTIVALAGVASVRTSLTVNCSRFSLISSSIMGMEISNRLVLAGMVIA